MNKEELWFWICNIENIWQNDLKKIFEVYSSPEEVYESDRGELFTRLCISGIIEEYKIDLIEKYKSSDDWKYKYDRMKNNGIFFIYYMGPNYPSNLMEIENAPYSLYVKGKMPDEKFPAAGMVGARACTTYGSQKAENIASYLASEKIQIISGMATGVDSVSAKGAIKAGGKTFAVLGSGVDVIYPKANMNLYYEIIMNGGGIISEYPLGTQPVAWQFPHRNRLIAALSDTLLVIEARKKSGTLITASYAAEQGKNVYALPGRVEDPLSEGCNRLIADGAGILLDIVSISKELWSKGKYQKTKNMIEKKEAGMDDTEVVPGNDKEVMSENKKSKKASDKDLYSTRWPSGNAKEDIQGEIYRKIYASLSARPKHVQNIIEETGLDTENVILTLAELELEGLISQVSSDMYVRSGM